MEEYNVTFVHPTTGATLDALVNPNLTVYEIIDALLLEKFIDSPNLLTRYVLSISGGKAIEKNNKNDLYLSLIKSFKENLPLIIVIINKIRINAALRLNEGKGVLTVSGTNTLIAIKKAKP